MSMIPDQYVIEKFCQYGGYPKYNKRANTWTAGCPICREGSSWGKKRRLYYKLDKNYIFCFNCGWKGSTIDYVKHVTGMTFGEIMSETTSYNTNNVVQVLETEMPTKQTEVESLPHDSINLYDHTQVEWWMSSDSTTQQHKNIISKAIETVKRRKLDTCTNKPNTLWISLTDYTHKHRLILPFYDKTGKIVFYQSRDITNDTSKPKYLSKTGGEKSIFNIDKVDTRVDSLFLFEGPIDSCFVKNGIGVAGITNGPGEDLTRLQQSQLSDYRLYNKIWVLDSQWLDKTSKIKTNLLIEQGHTVFIWPESIGKHYKDLNDMCVDKNLPGIGYKFLEKHSYSGMKAKLMLKNLD